MIRKRLAILPARGGSKRIPMKNIINFHGKPMIAHVLESLLESKMFEKIHVSTDDMAIHDVASAYGCQPDFMRPESISGDFSSISEVVDYVVNRYRGFGEVYETVGVFFPTAVFLDAQTINEAVTKLETLAGSCELLSIKRYSPPIEWAFNLQSNGELIAKFPDKLSVRSQDIEESWHESGEFVIYNKNSFTPRADRVKYGFKVPYITVDIDTIDDLMLAEAIFSRRFVA